MLISKSRSYRTLIVLFSLALLFLLASCANEFMKGKSAYNKRNYDEAIEHFKTDGEEKNAEWIKSVEIAKKVEEEIRLGLTASREGKRDKAMGHFKKALDMKEEIPHLSRRLKKSLADVKDDLVRLGIEKLRDLRKNKGYTAIINMKPTIESLFEPRDPFYPEVSEIIAFAEEELKLMKEFEAKGDKQRNQGKDRAAIKSWKQALKHASAERYKKIRNKIYTVHKKIEEEVRAVFNGFIKEGTDALYAGEYDTTIVRMDQAVAVSRKNSDITLDAGLAMRYKRLAQENIKEREIRYAAAKEVADRKAAIAAYIKTYGKPMTPTVIDYSKENKITAIGEGRMIRGKSDRWYGSALIDEGKYRKLYCKIGKGYEVLVARNHLKQRASDDIVTKTWIQGGDYYFICENFVKGRFYPVLKNVEGAKAFKLDCTLYHELDK